MPAGGKITHGHSLRGKKTPEYNTWSKMIQRCHNKNSNDYERYGGKGINVCNEWRSSFDSFYNYMGNRPSNNHSIDRIDSSKGYEPGNVRWLENNLQNKNRSMCIYLDYNGEKLCLKDYCNAVGISYNTVKYRKNTLKWTLEESLEKVDGRNRRKIKRKV